MMRFALRSRRLPMLIFGSSGFHVLRFHPVVLLLVLAIVIEGMNLETAVELVYRRDAETQSKRGRTWVKDEGGRMKGEG